MINFILGRPGGGKSLMGVRMLCRELETTERVIVTNLPINIEALADWCHTKIKRPIDLTRRLRILNEVETIQFWLYSPKHEVTKRIDFPQPGGGTINVPDFSERSANWPGCLYIIDEVHLFFNARSWQKVSFDAEFFMSQHRHLRCDVILISQHPEKVDKNFRRNAQDFMEVRNLGNEKFVFGVCFPRRFWYQTFLDCPTPGSRQSPMETGTFKLDVSEYGGLYDTSAGVGLSGKIDTGEKRKGRSPAWLIVGAVCVCALAIAAPFAIGKVMHAGTSALLGFAGGKTGVLIDRAVQSKPKIDLPAPPPIDRDSSPKVVRPTESAAAAPVQAAPLKVQAVVGFGPAPRVILTDGREFLLRDPEVIGVFPNGVALRSEGLVPYTNLHDEERQWRIEHARRLQP